MFHRVHLLLRLLGPCLGALCAGCSTFGDRLAAAHSPEAIAQVAARYFVEDEGDESCVVAIAAGDGSVCFGCAGSATERSLFRIASLSKFFVAETLARFHAAGRIDLDRPVTDYSKMTLPPECARVTLRDLLRNRSGLPREFMSPWNPLDVAAACRCALLGSHIYADFDAREDFVRKLGRDPRLERLGRGEEVYSNVGYGLAGTVAEDALGDDLEMLLVDGLLATNGYADTTFTPRGTQTNRLTRACAGSLPLLVRRGDDVPEHRLGPALRGAGGLFSSASDCIRFFVSCRSDVEAGFRARPRETLQEGETCGLLRLKALSSGRLVLYRAGMIYGGASFVCFDPRAHRVVVVLRNVTGWPDSCLFKVMEALATHEGECCESN